MRLDKIDDERVEVTLSRRNLAAMLSKVERTDSARTMEKQEGEVRLVIRCEPDSDHYDHREIPPGPVHPLDDPGVKPRD